MILKNVIHLLIGVHIFILCSCSQDINTLVEDKEDLIDEVELTCFPDTPDPKQLEQGDPLPIVQGKIVSWAVSSDDDIAYSPPGKWVNIYGKTYYRYIERAEGAAIKINEVAASASNILTAAQLNRIVAIVAEQTINENKLIENRATISRELIKFKNGEVADEDLIKNLADDNGKLLAQLVKQSASVYGAIIQSMTNTQKNAMCEKRKISDHANSNTDILSALGKSFSGDESTVLKSLLSDLFMWATGVEKMNKVIDSGRPAVLFGFANLRVEDRAGEDVSSGLRGEASKIISNLLDKDQTAILDAVMVDQAVSLATYYSSRADLAHEVMSYQSEDSTVNLDVISNLSAIGESVEAELAIIQAKGMAKIIQSFTSDQMQVLIDFKTGNGD